MRTFRSTMILALLAFPFAATFGKETAEVTVGYVLAPARSLPEGLKAVAVIDSGVETQGAREDQRERKWSTMAADMMESMLANSAARFGSGLQVAQRRLTKQILQEKDLQLAGLVDAPTAEKAGKLLAVQGLIASRITISIDMQKTRKSTIDWAMVMGAVAQGAGNRRRTAPPPQVVYPAPNAPPNSYSNPRYRAAPGTVYVDPRSRDPRQLRYRRYSYDNRYRAQPGVVVVPAPGPAPAPVPVGPPPGGVSGGIGFGTKEVEEISRHLTVQCTFTLIDAVTGQAIVQYAPPPYQKVDKASPDFLFGSMHQEQLDPVDHFIGELVEQAVQEFVSFMVPTEVQYRYEVVGKHSRGEAGIRAIRADDFDTAFSQFQAETQKSKDASEAVFALGVIEELRSNPQQALAYYRQAASMDVKGEELQLYLSAKKRLTDHLPRIMKTPPPGAPIPEGAAPPPGGAGAPPTGAPSEPPDSPPASSGFGFTPRESSGGSPRRER